MSSGRPLLELPFKNLVKLSHSHFAGKNANRNKPAIVYLHGMLGSRVAFKQSNRSLANQMNTDVFAVDLRNHGTSPKARPYDYMTMSQDIVQFVQTHIGKDRPVHLVGVSMGGKVALLTTLSNAFKCITCTSVDLPPYETPELGNMVLSNYSVIMKILREEPGYHIKKNDRKWKEKITEMFKSLDANTDNFTHLHFSSGFTMNPANNVKTNESIEYLIPLQQMPDILNAVKAWPSEEELKYKSYSFSTNVPTLFCKALKSELIDPNYSLFGKQYPNYEVVEFETSHNIITEATADFYRTLADFMRKHE